MLISQTPLKPCLGTVLIVSALLNIASAANLSPATPDSRYE